MKGVQMSQEPEMDELQMRSAFIQLDVRARQVGGVEHLTPMDQRFYVQFGRKTGLLTEEQADELAQLLNLKQIGDWPA